MRLLNFLISIEVVLNLNILRDAPPVLHRRNKFNSSRRINRAFRQTVRQIFDYSDIRYLPRGGEDSSQDYCSVDIVPLGCFSHLQLRSGKNAGLHINFIPAENSIWIKLIIAVQT